MGTVMGAVISCLIEMTALMPVNAPVMEFPRRFLDRGVGFSIGWMYWYAYNIAEPGHALTYEGLPTLYWPPMNW
jgi:amino acid permease